MQEEDLMIKTKKRRKYNSYQGEIAPSVPNLMQRDFHANKPNEKRLTDITEFSISNGKIFLSSFVDYFNGMLPCWIIGIAPDSSLENRMLDQADSQLNKTEPPSIHSDRGCHYQRPGWIKRIEKSGLNVLCPRKAVLQIMPLVKAWLGK